MWVTDVVSGRWEFRIGLCCVALMKESSYMFPEELMRGAAQTRVIPDRKI